jgi:hypothetical protein
MNLGTGVSPFAKRLKEKQGWLVAGAFVVAIFSVLAYQGQSTSARYGFGVTAVAALVVALWLFNRGSLKHP